MASHDGEGAARSGDVLHMSGDGDGDRDRVECAHMTLNSRCQCTYLRRNRRLYRVHHSRLHSPRLCRDDDGDVVDGVAFAGGAHASVESDALHLVLPPYDDRDSRNFRQPLIAVAMGHRITDSGDDFYRDVDTVESSACGCKARDTVSSRGFVRSSGRHTLAFDFPSLLIPRPS